MKYIGGFGPELQDLTFAQEVKQLSRVNFDRCYQCSTCTLGCPLSFSMDFLPHQIIRMAQLGYEVTGIDSSPDMLSIAEEKAKKAGLVIDFKCVDVNELNTAGEYQAAYCLGYTFLYMTTYSAVMSFFTSVKKALLPQGIFLVDFINGWSLIEEFNRDKFVYRQGNTTIFHFGLSYEINGKF